jgi:hypothetical protein
MADRQHLAAFARSVHHRRGLVRIESHRLLDEHVTACRERFDGQRAVALRWGENVNDVRLRGLEELVSVSVRPLHAEPPSGRLAALVDGVADADHFDAANMR